MRKLCWLLAAAAMVAYGTQDAQAAVRPRLGIGSMSTGSGPFARLMELERRKNERLRQIFFGG
jgi:hypothetical protein